MYLTAHYGSSQYAENEVVVWDYIVVSPEQAHIQLKNKKIKLSSFPSPPCLVCITQRSSNIVFLKGFGGAIL